MKKFEYKFIEKFEYKFIEKDEVNRVYNFEEKIDELKRINMEYELNEFGQKGWELVNLYTYENNGYGERYKFIFKREINND